MKVAVSSAQIARARKRVKQRQVIEQRFSKKIEPIFRRIAREAGAIYRSSQDVSAQDLAMNYYAEFETEIKKTARSSIAAFGFEQRERLEKSHGLKLDTMTKKMAFITKQSDVKDEFNAEAAIFIGEMSDFKAKKITETNTGMIKAAIERSEARYAEELRRAQQNYSELVRGQQLLKAKAPTARDIAIANGLLQRLLTDKNKIIGQYVDRDIAGKAASRGVLIATDIVGLSQAWAKQTEVEKVNEAGLTNSDGEEIKLRVKTWISVLIETTRPAHGDAHGEQVPVDEPFEVDGEDLMFPRDDSLGATVGNLINCYCEADYE